MEVFSCPYKEQKKCLPPIIYKRKSLETQINFFYLVFGHHEQHLTRGNKETLKNQKSSFAVKHGGGGIIMWDS